MKKLSSKQMQKSIEKILKALNVYDKFMSNPHTYVKISNGSYMPLVIEKHDSHIMLTHYFEQNGDLVPDPDMEFQISEDGWYPVAIQFAIGTYRRCVIKD